MPDLVAVAKCLGGGVPCGAIGGTDEAFSVVENFDVWQVGTFNGNPLRWRPPRRPASRS